jgi:hypothetical protein
MNKALKLDHLAKIEIVKATEVKTKFKSFSDYLTELVDIFKPFNSNPVPIMKKVKVNLSQPY